MLYVDQRDRSVRWEAYVRRKFLDGVWLWAVGPPQNWHTPADHHAYCCADGTKMWEQTQHAAQSHVAMPFSRHLRCGSA